MYSRGEEVGNTSLVLNPCSFAEMKKKLIHFLFLPRTTQHKQLQEQNHAPLYWININKINC